MRTAALVLLLGAPRLAAQAPVPMHEEPRHRLVLTHQQVRVMDVQIRPGDTTLFHVHDLPGLYVAVSVAPVDIQLLHGPWNGALPTDDPGRIAGGVNVDTSYVRQPVTHRVTNVGSQLFNLIAITSSSLSPRDPGSPELPGMLELTTRWFWQSRVYLTPDATPRRYSAPSPTIVVQPLPGAATVVLESGDRHALNTPGSWALVPAGTRYQLTTSTAATLTVVLVM
jgi:hypothetical protein